jgi:endonuclease/exonuclease/phosphatase family metal-dependent hydrolase
VVAAPVSPRHLQRIFLTLIGCLVLVASLLWWLRPTHYAPTELDLNSSGQPGDTVFKIASFNVLGHSHTQPGGNKPGYATSAIRTAWANEVLNVQAMDIVGFQELQAPQLKKIQQLQGNSWEFFPGSSRSNAAMQNSIGWRTAVWRRVSVGTIPIPYFYGRPVPMPYVQLAHVRTGRRIFVYNAHHPASTRGPAQHWRDEATRRGIALVNRLRAKFPTTPVFVTGDMNDRADYFCPTVRQTDLEAANGGTSTKSGCNPPADLRIDWILGTSDAEFSRYEALDGGLIDRITDHPIITSQVQVPPLTQPTIQRVLVITIDGLRSRALSTDLPQLATFQQLKEEGTSTYNARTGSDSVTPQANLLSLLTGRRANAALGGHGVLTELWSNRTVHSAAGQYTSSIFDRVHNFGMNTFFIGSTPQHQVIDLTWNQTNGGADPFAVDDGRDKIDRAAIADGDGAATQTALSWISKRPQHFMLVAFSDLDQVGKKYGFGTNAYRAELARTDQRIGQLLAAVAHSPRLAPSTLVIVASTSGGLGRGHEGLTQARNYRVPIFISGPGVPAANLYQLNPQRVNPGRQQLSESAARQPIRASDIANFVCSALVLPTIPGSQANYERDLAISAPGD